VTAIAIDIGGTKLAAGLVDADGSVLSRTTAATPKTSDSEQLFGLVAGLVVESRRARADRAGDRATAPEPVVCGVGLPASIEAG
jgi:glucokinase